jgi:integrase
MASLQARHQRGCKLGKPWTKGARDALVGCTCKPSPMFHAVIHTGPGGRVSVGRNFKEAERALRKMQTELDAGEYQEIRNMPFNEWADTWLNGLRRPRESTKATYRVTVAYAKQVFGSKRVRAIGPADIDRFLEHLVAQGMGASTQAKHLRHLSACFKAAVRKGYAGRNPIDTLGPEERPQAEVREAAYFEDDELPRLFAALAEHDRPLFRLALRTGMRQDEMLSLTWRDVDLNHGQIRVGIAKTADGRRRVDLVPEAVELLKQHRAAVGAIPLPSMLVFPGTRGKRSASRTTKLLYAAMAAATENGEANPIPRVGPTGVPRTFHSLRHTFARIALESAQDGEAGAELTWLSRQMGHSSAAFTEKRYGHWARKARQEQARRLAGRFNF